MQTSPHHVPCDGPSADAAPAVIGDLVQRATQAHAALMRGDLGRYRSLILHSDDFALMAPFGGKPTRAVDLSSERWEAIGRFFRNGRDSTLELVHAYHSTDMVVLAAIERTHVEVGDMPGQDWSLRVTLVFRRDKEQGKKQEGKPENGHEKERWLLVHRHADPLVGAIPIEQAAALARGASAS